MNVGAIEDTLNKGLFMDTFLAIENMDWKGKFLITKS